MSDSSSVAAATSAFLQCLDPQCGKQYPLGDVRSECACGNLLDVRYEWPGFDPEAARQTWSFRSMSRDPRDRSGVWRFREMIPYLPDDAPVITLQEGNTPLLDAPRAADYAGLDFLAFKHQGFNPTGSFKDNGMTTGASQAAALGRNFVACVSTGNTSASMAAYAARGGLQAVIFLPAGQIASGKLSQSLEYGALTIQVEANFDVTWKLVFQLVEETGIYLLNSVNPFRIEGQKTIMIELLEQMGWEPPDWVVLPAGNLGNSSAFGKGLREMQQLGLISRLPRLALVQAEGAAPLYHLLRRAEAEKKSPGEMGLEAVRNPHTLATAIRIGAPASWKKALRELAATNGICEAVSEQEIADAKAVIGLSGIGCEPASAATLAGIRKLVAANVIDKSERVVAVLTGNLLKDPAYTLAYHQGTLSLAGEGPAQAIQPRFSNQPVSVPPDADVIRRLLERRKR
jgi:threonine synthase